jgi:hypothetical protein
VIGAIDQPSADDAQTAFDTGEELAIVLQSMTTAVARPYEDNCIDRCARELQMRLDEANFDYRRNLMSSIGNSNKYSMACT